MDAHGMDGKRKHACNGKCPTKATDAPVYIIMQLDNGG